MLPEDAGLLAVCSLLLEGAGLFAVLRLPCEEVPDAIPEDWLREGPDGLATLFSPAEGEGLDAASLPLPCTGRAELLSFTVSFDRLTASEYCPDRFLELPLLFAAGEVLLAVSLLWPVEDLVAVLSPAVELAGRLAASLP